MNQYQFPALILLLLFSIFPTVFPRFRLRLFRHFDPFRILICSGDGSIGWVLSEIDKLHMDVGQFPSSLLRLLVSFVTSVPSHAFGN